jgi:uncharacterized protein (TIGR02996 family)
VTPTTDATEAALRATVAENPHDDAPKLVYADWLEQHGRCLDAGEQRLLVQLRAVVADPFDDAPRLEYARICDLHGQPERGKFIRVGCQIEAWGCTFKQTKEQPGWKHNCGTDDRGYWLCQPLRSRERDLLFDYWPGWCREAIPDADFTAGDDNQFTAWEKATAPEQRGRRELFRFSFHRGFVDEARLPLAALVGGGGECPACNGSGCELMPCVVCDSTGRTPGVAGRLAACPVTSVTLTNCEPYERDDVSPRTFQWIEQTRRAFEREQGDGGTPSSVMGALHKDLFRLLVPHPKYRKRDERANERMPDDRRLTYPTREAALLALSHAAVNLCRSLAPGFTHQVPCGRCKGKTGDLYGIGLSCVSVAHGGCGGKGTITRPGLAPLVFPEGGSE